MNHQSYTTKMIADSIGVHVNTLRFYEESGLITKPARQYNGYRIYTDLQLDQCKLIRKIMQAEVLQNGLRAKAIQMIRLLAGLNFDGASVAIDEYCQIIDAEIINAQAAVIAVERILHNAAPPDSAVLRRHEVAQALDVTPETLRTWERNGLIAPSRSKNGYRTYGAMDMERLNMIRTLRCANYSLSAILRLLNGLDRNEVSSVEAVLNTPCQEDDIISVCDQLLVSLRNAKENAHEVMDMIKKMKEKYTTLQ